MVNVHKPSMALTHPGPGPYLIEWLKEKFCIMISVQPCNILYISKNSQSVILQKYQLFILKKAGEGSSITDS